MEGWPKAARSTRSVHQASRTRRVRLCNDANVTSTVSRPPSPDDPGMSFGGQSDKRSRLRQGKKRVFEQARVHGRRASEILDAERRLTIDSRLRGAAQRVQHGVKHEIHGGKVARETTARALRPDCSIMAAMSLAVRRAWCSQQHGLRRGVDDVGDAGGTRERTYSEEIQAATSSPKSTSQETTMSAKSGNCDKSRTFVHGRRDKIKARRLTYGDACHVHGYSVRGAHQWSDQQF